MAAIPTKFMSCNFRSRIEARWAAFFDLLGWRWEYEPLDLDGYIPDFSLQFPAAPLLVEVKCELEFENLRRYTRKIDESGWIGEVLIVGACLWHDTWTPTIGLLGEMVPGVASDEPEAAPSPPVVREWGRGLLHVCNWCGNPSIHHAEQSYKCRVSGCYKGCHYLSAFKNIEDHWRQAGNYVQWKGVAV
jgi:hypothetical protein